MSEKQIISPDSHALAVAFDSDKKPACLLLSVDAVTEGGDLAISATKVSLDGTNMVLSGPDGDLVLQNVSQMCLDAANVPLPLVIIDPHNQRENKVQFSLTPTKA
jgi:hypothetical protein